MNVELDSAPRRESDSPSRTAADVMRESVIPSPQRAGNQSETAGAGRQVDVLSNPTKTIDEKAAAAQSLFDQSPKNAHGLATFKVQEAAGEREYSVSSVNVSHNTRVSAIFTKDANGVERPVLRWVDRGGRIEKQVGTTGSVDFQSNYAAQHLTGNAIASLGASARREPPRETTGVAPRQSLDIPALQRPEQPRAVRLPEMRQPEIQERPLENGGTRGERVAIRLPNSIVNVPKDLDPSKPIHFMTYFNGWQSSHSDAYRTARLQEQVRDAPPNTVLVSARWQDVEHSSNSSHRRFSARGGLRGILGEVANGVPQLERQGGLNAGDSVGLAAFSAGYNAVDHALNDKALANRVTNIVMLDSPSSTARQFVYDHLADFASGRRRMSFLAGDWRSQDYSGFSDELQRRFRRAGLKPADYMYDGRHRFDSPRSSIARSRPISFMYTQTQHSQIPSEWSSG